MKSVGVAFIGTGMVSELHEQALRELHGAKLVGCLGGGAEETERRAGQWGIRPFADVDALLNDSDVDCVFVLSPLERHIEHATQALRKGKHVLVEKPVGPNPADIRTLDQTAKECGRVCMPVHNYIYNPEVRRTKRLIENGDLGKICAAWINYMIHHPEEIAGHYPGILRQVGTHHFYTLLYLLGRPDRLYASDAHLIYEKLTTEDQVMLQLELPGGAHVSLFASFAMNDETSDPWMFVIKVLGTKGGCHVTWKSAIFARPLGTMSQAIVPYEESFTNTDRYFIEECIGQGHPPLSTLEDAAVAAVLIEAAEESIKTKNTVTCR